MELVQLIILHACNILEINFPFQWIPSVLSGKFSLKVMVIMKSENKSNTPAINTPAVLIKNEFHFHRHNKNVFCPPNNSTECKLPRCTG